MTDTALPAPLTPADSDLTKFGFMPLDVARLRSSDLASIASAEAFRAAVLLWCACWHQKPAASLPDDDRVLAQLAGFGRFVKEWAKVKAEAMRGFVKCSDGRLYHKVVAEKANEAWRQKEAQRARTEAARNARNNSRNSGGGGDDTVSVTDDQKTLLQRPTEKEREKETQSSTPPPPEPQAAGGPAAPQVASLTQAEWFSRVDGLIAILPGINRTTGGLANVAPLRSLVEPTDPNEKPCDWVLDVVPAARAAAAVCEATGGLRSWTHPVIAQTAKSNRDARLNGGKPDDRSTKPRNGGSAPSAIDRARLRRQNQPSGQAGDGEGGEAVDQHPASAEAHH